MLEKEKSEDINLEIRQFTKKGEIQRAPMNISVDYLSYIVINNVILYIK